MTKKIRKQTVAAQKRNPRTKMTQTRGPPLVRIFWLGGGDGLGEAREENWSGGLAGETRGRASQGKLAREPCIGDSRVGTGKNANTFRAFHGNKRTPL